MNGITCPECNHTKTGIVKTDLGPGYRSRCRECQSCGHRFWTCETVGKEPYNRKLVGFLHNCLDQWEKGEHSSSG